MTIIVTFFIVTALHLLCIASHFMASLGSLLYSTPSELKYNVENKSDFYDAIKWCKAVTMKNVTIIVMEELLQ